MFRALAGRTVHAEQGTALSLIAAATKAAPPLASVAPTVPALVASLVDRALAFHKQRRWPSAAAMQDAVRHAYRALAEERPGRRRACELSPEPSARRAPRRCP